MLDLIVPAAAAALSALFVLCGTAAPLAFLAGLALLPGLRCSRALHDGLARVPADWLHPALDQVGYCEQTDRALVRCLEGRRYWV